MQNIYHLLDRTFEPLLGACRDYDVAWVPYFPLGGGGEYAGLPKVVDDTTVQSVAAGLGATPTQVGLAWQLTHALNTMLIPGMASPGHLRENIAAGDLNLDAATMTRPEASTGERAATRSRFMTTTIAGVRLVDLTGKRNLLDVDVEFESTILHIRAAGTATPVGDMIDGGGRFLLPGLIDTLVHLSDPGALEAAARAGVTTVIDFGTHPDSLIARATRRTRRRQDRQCRFRGLRAGQHPDCPDGVPPASGVTSPDVAERYLDWRTDSGSELIKIIVEDPAATDVPALDVPTIIALVDSAHRRGLLTVAHVVTAAAFDRALDAKVYILTPRPPGPSARRNDLAANGRQPHRRVTGADHDAHHGLSPLRSPRRRGVPERRRERPPHAPGRGHDRRGDRRQPDTHGARPPRSFDARRDRAPAVGRADVHRRAPCRDDSRRRSLPSPQSRHPDRGRARRPGPRRWRPDHRRLSRTTARSDQVDGTPVE